MSEQQRGRRAIEAGPTGKTVAANIARLRKARGLTTRQLSAALERAGRHIPASGITRMEKAERQVTADDLTAFATVFYVSPAALLLPPVDDPARITEITGAGEVPADVAWAWAFNERPLRLPDGDTRTVLLEYELYGLPPGRRSFTPAAGARDVVEVGATAYGLQPAPGPGARPIAALGRKRLQFEDWMTRADQGDRGELLRTFRESDPEVFEPQVTEWLEERGLLSTREVNTDG